MEYINHSLGIPVKGHFNDHISSRFLNASGFKRKKSAAVVALTVLFPPAGIAYAVLGPTEKKKYQEVMGTASNPQTSKINEFEANLKASYPFNANMSSGQLESIVESLNSEYQKADLRRDTLASNVAKSGKRFSVDPNRSWIAELQDVRAWMYAINEHRAKVVRAYDKAFAREEKAAETPSPTTPPPSNQPPPAGNAPVFGSTDRLGTGESVGLGTGISDTAEKLKNVASEGVNVGGKKIPLMTIALVAAGAGAVYYFFIRK